jgi:hypothetical protein
MNDGALADGLGNTLAARIAAHGMAGDDDVERYLARLEAAQRMDPPPWPDDDPPPFLPAMDPGFTWSTSDLEAIDAYQAWSARQDARR